MGRRRRKKKRRGGEREERKPTKPLTDEIGQQIVEWAEEAAETHDLEVWDVVARPNWVLQIFVDKPGAVQPGDGVTVDDCANVSRYVEAFLDVDERVWPSYTIEVSSPGMERKLETKRHYELSVGRGVRVVVHEPIEKRNVFEGVLVDFDEDAATVRCGPDDDVRIDWDNIARARLSIDFEE